MGSEETQAEAVKPDFIGVFMPAIAQSGRSLSRPRARASSTLDTVCPTAGLSFPSLQCAD